MDKGTDPTVEVLKMSMPKNSKTSVKMFERLEKTRLTRLAKAWRGAFAMVANNPFSETLVV